MTRPPLQLPDRPFAAFLFDLDGTVADSMPLHFRSWTQAVREQGCTFPLELFIGWGGVPLPRTVEMLNERFGYQMDPEVTSQRKEDLYLQLLDELTPVAATLEHVEAFHGKIPFAIVSGSPRATIIGSLERLGLLDRFDLLVGAEDYTHGKPDPEPFLVAAKRLGIAPADCLVFEDADAGIASAEAAGMEWVRVPHAHMEPIPEDETPGGAAADIAQPRTTLS